MNTLKKQLAFLLVFSILFSLLSGLSAKAALPSTPTLKDNKIFANGITNGTDKDTFHPNAECNRAQILTFLYRFASLSEKSKFPFIIKNLRGTF